MTAGEGESCLSRRFSDTLHNRCRHLDLLYPVTSLTNQKLRWLMFVIAGDMGAGNVLVGRIQAVDKLIVF